MDDFLPNVWFAPRTIYKQIQAYFPLRQKKIRIASGWFTIEGWNLIRGVTADVQIDLLVGINDKNKRSDIRDAQRVIVDEIMQDLKTGILKTFPLGTDLNRRRTVKALIERIRLRQFRIVDARAMRHHAKLYLIDDQIALITSANLTLKGLTDQIEAGDRVIAGSDITKLVSEFDRYFSEAKDLTQELLDALERWLRLASPWEIYLKTLLALEDIDLDDHYKLPTAYQRDMIAESLGKLRDYSGVMLVASTGLGKTIVATHIALQLFRKNEIKNALVIGPKLIKHQWKSEFRSAGIPFDYIGYHTLDKEDPKHDRNLNDFFDIQNELNKKWLIIIDECHVFRNGHDDEDDAEGFGRFAFQRLVPQIRASGCKVLLLTGSPYSTNVQNLNDQLCLLPHTAETEATGKGNRVSAWQVKNIDEFISLPVVSQLTTPHVAKEYGHHTKTTISIDFGQEKRYIPNVILSCVNFSLFLSSEVVEAFQSGCLAVEIPLQRRNAERLAEIAWTSSPWALCNVLQKVIATPGDPKKSYKFKFKMSELQREEKLTPILEQVKTMRFTNDSKLLSLCTLIEKIHPDRNKVVIFCERHPTVTYLVEAITELFPKLRVFGTIDKVGERYVPKSQSKVIQAIQMFAPVANGVKGKYKDTYDLFISTDAHGVGINLQDAPIVINYDLAWTPIDPIQRAGRVLRPWIKPRTVTVYTFAPVLSEELSQTLQGSKRLTNLMHRHKQSQEILELPVLSINEEEIVNLHNSSSKIRIQSGKLNLDALLEEKISSYYQHQHASKLHQHRNRARKIPDDIVSAKTYSGQSVLIYILLRQETCFHWIAYEPKTKTLLNISREQLLTWLQCEPNTNSAIVSDNRIIDVDTIERFSNRGIKSWCKQQKLDVDSIVKVCAAYLIPETVHDELEKWLMLNKFYSTK